MPTNVTYEYIEAEKEYHKAGATEEKIRALENMLRTCPSHKGCESLRQQLKQRLSKLKALQKSRKSKKGSSKAQIKKEGAARVVIIGATNSGKSTLLNKLTNAKALVAEYEFTTKEPEVGTLDYNGIKIQVIEIPAIVENFNRTASGPEFLALVKEADIIILTYKNEQDKNLVIKELWKNNIELPIIYYNNEDVDQIKELIWKNLKLVYVFTKMPGKKPDYPPIALPRNSTIEDLARTIHKDFLAKFKFAKIFGKSAKFEKGQQVGLKHELQDGDVVEIHLK